MSRYAQRPRRDPQDRFWERVDKTGDCWVWTGTRNPRGYGQFTGVGKSVGAHRFAYESLLGPIPPGLELDHLCRNRACVNPEHLEPVTQLVNILRGEGESARNARKTHCIRGHPFDDVNTCHRSGRRGNGRRTCRTCVRISKREHRRSQALARVTP